jgi:hypothetical protein
MMRIRLASLRLMLGDYKKRASSLGCQRGCHGALRGSK